VADWFDNYCDRMAEASALILAAFLGVGAIFALGYALATQSLDNPPVPPMINALGLLVWLVAVSHAFSHWMREQADEWWPVPGLVGSAIMVAAIGALIVRVGSSLA
jgi:hypothetical protein